MSAALTTLLSSLYTRTIDAPVATPPGVRAQTMIDGAAADLPHRLFYAAVSIVLIAAPIVWNREPAVPFSRAMSMKRGTKPRSPLPGVRTFF